MIDENKMVENESSIDTSSVVIYVRESNHHNATDGLERQKKRLIDYCQKHGCEVVGEYTVIGSRKEGLESLKKAIEYTKNSDTNILLMASINRVVGTTEEMVMLSDMINKSDLIIATMDGSYESLI